MYIVLKIEVKNNYNGNVEYLQEDAICKTESIDEAKAIVKDETAKTITNGYFDKIIYQGDNMVQLTNGGTAYLKYKIHKI